MKLNQVIALVQGRKARATKTITDAYRCWQTELLKGLTRNYQPLDDAGEKLPSESKVVSLHANEVIKKVVARMNEYYDCVATQECANQEAKANVTIGETIILKDMPVTVLLFFEKQLVDLLTFAKSLPVLPVDKEWRYDEKRGCFITEPEVTTRTQKQPKVIVKYNATPEHPAQTELFSEDKVVGHWSTVHMSGALTKEKRDGIIDRIEKLQDAVKKAREEANGYEIGKDILNHGTTLVDYIFMPEGD